jgi:membrane protease YdiL (CAAX protease family)
MSRKKYKNEEAEKAIEVGKALLTLFLVFLSYYVIQGFLDWALEAADVKLSMAVMLIISALIWLGAVVISALARKKNILEENRFAIKKDKKQLWILPLCGVLAFCLGVSMNYLVGFFVDILPVPEKWIQANQESVTTLYDHGAPIAVFVALYVLVPIVEEMIFRGKGFAAVEKSCGTAVAVVLTSLLFAVAHGNVLQGIYAFAAALVFSLIIAKSGSLLTGIFAHAGFNISGPLLMAMFKNVNEVYVIVGCFAVTAIALSGILAAGSLTDNEPEEETEDDEFSGYDSLD